MKTFKIKSANELHNFLKVLAEESVTQARGGLTSEKERQTQMMRQIGHDKQRFMSEEDPPEPSNTEAPEPEPAPEPKVKKPAPLTASEISPKYESLVDAINSLRGAGSTRDSSVDTQLRAYYDKLDSAECAALIVMLRSVTDVMTGVIPGDQAKDPSNYKIKVTMEKTQQAPAEEPAEPEEAETEPEAEPVPEAGEEDEENTAPPQKLPISVGQGMTESYRQKIRSLLRNT
jgi:hypothetical protein